MFGKGTLPRFHLVYLRYITSLSLSVFEVIVMRLVIAMTGS